MQNLAHINGVKFVYVSFFSYLCSRISVSGVSNSYGNQGIAQIY